jgi:PAS domain-containing protein
MASAVADLIELGTFVQNIRTGRLVWSDGLCRIYGVDPERQAISLDLPLRRCHPADITRLEAGTRAVLTLGAVDFEHRIVRPDRTIRRVLVRATLEHDDLGPTRVAGIVVDVTAIS